MEDIEVPSHFLCPISLEIMRDPVTISTGITYDRESIERWLFSSKNNTCPVTKQPLFDDDNVDLTPNHTLRRIIQAWCTLNSSHGVERIPTPRSPLDKSQIVKLIEQAKKAPQTNLHCLRQLRSVALKQSERHLSCLEDAGAIEYAASIINNGSDNSDPSTTEVAIEVLFLMKISDAGLKDLMSNYGVVGSLVGALKCGNFQSRSHAIILLQSVFEVADPGQLVNVDVELFRQIVLVLQDRISPKASKAALKLLVELYPWGRNRIKAVEGGAVFVLVECLLGANEKRICELILIVLDQLCGCAEGRAELLKHGAGIAVVSKKILRVSHVASDRAVRILSAVSRFSATSGVVQEMLQVGVVAKLCLVLQVDCRFKTKEKAREVLKLHSRVWKNSSCIPGHLLPFYPSSSS